MQLSRIINMPQEIFSSETHGLVHVLRKIKLEKN